MRREGKIEENMTYEYIYIYTYNILEGDRGGWENDRERK